MEQWTHIGTCNNRAQRRQKNLHQVILCIVQKIPEYFYCVERGSFTAILSWLTGVSLLEGLALGRAECLLQIQRWNELMFHSCFIFIYEVMWLHRRKRSRNHPWEAFVLKINFIHDIIVHFLGGWGGGVGCGIKNKTTLKMPFLMCEQWCNESIGF